MSHSVHVHTIRLPLRKICSALPSVALISGAIMLPASAAPSAQSHVGLASSSSPTVVVPSTALTLPDSSPILADRSPRHSPNTPTSQPLASMLSAGTVPGSSSLVTLDDAGIPVRALESYRKATSLISSADPACHIDWALLAAIGRVESDHARVGGNQLDSTGVAQPGIIGVALNGSNGTALITDTDRGLLDGDTTYDRAVGPMQFIPSTWRLAGTDANGDGVKNPQDMADATATTAVYLCSGHTDLRRPNDLRSAILRYNASDPYVDMVTAIADAYRHGVRALPASDLTPIHPSTVASRTSAMATKHTNRPPGRPVPARPRSAPAATTGQKPALTPASGSTSGPGLPPPSLAPPAGPQAAATTPTTTCVPIPSPPSTTSPTSPPSDPAPPTSAPPAASQTCLPPCVTTSPTSTASPTSTPSGDASPTPSQSCLTPCAPTTAPSSTSSTTSAQPCLTQSAGTSSTTAP